MKYFLKIDNLVILILIFAYLATRLLTITVLPIFNDESIYIYWAKLIATSGKQWFISLTAFQPPLFIWSMIVFLKILPHGAYLVAGRIASVLSGLIGLIGIYNLTKILFNSRKISIVLALLFIFSPYYIFYDRIAANDSLLSALGIWVIYFSIKSAKTLKIRYVAPWGLGLGLALLTKTSGELLILTSIPAFLILAAKENRYKLIIYPLTAVFIAKLIDSILFLSHFYHNYSSSSVSRFSIPVSTLIHNPFIVFIPNLKLVMPALFTYYTWPIFLTGALGLLFIFISSKKTAIILFISWLLPILTLLFIDTDPYPRHFLFTTPYLLIAASYSLVYIFRKKIIGISASVLYIAFLVWFDLPLLINPINAPLPFIDYYQYVSGYPSGYGLQEAFSFLREQSKSRQINIITLGTISSYPYAFNLEFWDDRKVTILPIWPIGASTQSIIARLSKDRPTYIVLKFNSYQGHKDFLSELHLRKILAINKPGGKNPIIIATLIEK